MWQKIKDRLTVLSIWILFIFSFFMLLYVPVKCGFSIVDRIKNPPSEIYAENQVFDEWKSYCIDRYQDDCDLWGWRLKTKSFLYENLDRLGVPRDDNNVDIVSVIEVDEFYSELSIKIKDWNTGEIINPFPQKEIKWYELFKSYDSYESTGLLADEDLNIIKNYELTIFRDKIVISEDSCDSRGLEKTKENTEGGCFFLEKYMDTESEWYSLRIMLKNDKYLIINL